MVFIKVDVIKLGSFIDNLRDWIVDAESSRKAVRDKVSAEDPAQIRDVVSDSSTMLRVTNHLSSLRGSLETRKINVEAVNRESGKLDTDVECGYYLPDGVEDTTANVTEHNIKAIQAAKADAKADYDRHKGKNPARSTHDSAEKYKDNPVYASTYIHELGKQPGVDKNDSGVHVFLDMLEPIESSAGSPGQDIMMHILAAASQDEVNGKKLAQEIYANDGKQVSAYWYQERRWALTYALSYEGTKFGTDFLTTLASKAENDPDASSWLYGQTKAVGGKEYTADILAGAMNAMSRNPEAALEYLAGDVTVDAAGNVTPSPTTNHRWLKLSQRTWDGGLHYGFGTDAFTAALAAASGYRNLTDDQAGLKNADARATWLSGETIKLFSSGKYGANTYLHDIPENSKRNLGVVLANSPEEIASLAGGSQMGSEDITGPRMSCSEKQAASLLYRIIDNEDAAATVAAKLGDYHQRRIDEQLSKNPQFLALSDEYNKAASSEAFLEKMAETRYEHNKKNNADKESTVNTASTVFGAVLAGAVTVGTGGMAAPAAALIGSGVSVSTAFAQPAVADEVMRDIGTKTNAPTKDVSVRNRLEAQAYSDAAEHNLFAKEVNKAAVDEGIVLKDGQKIDPVHNTAVTNWRHRSARQDGRVNYLSEEGIGNGIERGEEAVSTLLSEDSDYKKATE
mgnify:CR=1 FL=1